MIRKDRMTNSVMIAYKSFDCLCAIRIKKVLFIQHQDNAVFERHVKEVKELNDDVHHFMVVSKHVLKDLFGEQLKADWTRVRLTNLHYRMIN